MDSNQFIQLLHGIAEWPESPVLWESMGGDLASALGLSCVLRLDQELHTLHASPEIKAMLDDQPTREILFQRLMSARSVLEAQQSNLLHWVSISDLSAHQALADSFSDVVWIQPNVQIGARQKDWGAWVLAFPKRPSEVQRLMIIGFALKLNELAVRASFSKDISQRNQFLAVATHELKTPLTALYGILQLQMRVMRVKKKEDLTTQEWDQHLQFLNVMLHQVERIRDLMNDLLSVSRIESGQFTIERTLTNVSELVHQCVQTRLKILAQQASVSLEEDLQKEVSAYVDPMRLEEVITNLVMNSIRFSPEGGIIYISLKKEGSQFRLLIRDQGPSIFEEDRERVFQPFERAQKTNRLGGLGLGLYISRQIAQLHGGNVVLKESLVGAGNLFEATFPLNLKDSQPV